MKYIHIKEEKHIQHIFLDSGKSNALDLLSVEELTEAIKEAESRENIEGIILHGKEGFFSSGLDLIKLYEYDESQILTFWQKFMTLVDTLAGFTKPAIAAISGHSPAGGCILTLCCDYRVMVRGDFVIGLNEVPIGIVVPPAIFKLYSFWIGEAMAYKSLLTGKLFTPEEALEIQLVDELTEANKIRTSAEQKLNDFTQFEKNAWRKSKLNFRKHLLESLKENREESINQVLEQWWKPNTREVLKTLIDNLGSKGEK